MNILIDDGMQIDMGTGIGNYTHHVYTYAKTLPGIDVDLAQYHRTYANKVLDRLRYVCHLHSLSYHRKLKAYDVVHYTNYAMPLWKRKDTKYLVTIHDLASILHPTMNGIWYRLFNKRSIRKAVRSADLILTVSETVKTDLIRLFPMVKHKIEVLYPGLSKEKVAIHKDIQDAQVKEIVHHAFFLFVGTLEKRKNIKRILEAFFSLKAQAEQDIKLVLAGRKGYGFEELQGMIETSDYASEVLITGYLCDSDINHLYKHARVFLFPSLYEGFGTPQLESMYWNISMIVSDISTNREVSNGYARYFDVHSLSSFVDAMSQALKAPRGNHVPRSYLQAFYWDTLIVSYQTMCQKVVQGAYDKK